MIIVILLVSIGILAYLRIPLKTATPAYLAVLLVLTLFNGLSILLLLIWVLSLGLLIPLNTTTWRRNRLSALVLDRIRRNLPHISRTEQEAIDAGDTWWDAELFSGKPDWQRLRDLPAPVLSKEERAFLDGPVETLCTMLDDWEITHRSKDLPPEVWDFIKQHRFFGMIIPQEYGGLDFSNLAHSQVIMKIASRSITAAVTVMVPNSLGPAKLLLNYGTEDQKKQYLARLASGEEIPCFALTGPHAGSDAASIPDTGVVCRGDFGGQQDILGIRLNWEKRYITLGPVATLLGLAFKLYDPDHLLGDVEDIGITLALIPTDTAGIDIGNRHWPMDIPFQNGPNRGKDVFIPMDYLIGGTRYVGQGWRMLMESLSDGRAISLPALSTGAAKLASRVTGAYARVRRQFNLPIGRFEGIEEPLAHIAGNAYLMDAARTITAQALDAGEKPSVITAIIKYELTERMRVLVNDAMDIHGGSGICLGPSNYLGRVYQGVPISITVEGANILTRSLIIFGQGAIRCHPYLLHEIRAAELEDHEQALYEFDQLFWAHTGFVLSNAVRALWLGLSNAGFVRTPGNRHTRKYYRQLARLSAGFALLTDAAVLVLGGNLKRRERISGRFADVLSNLYLCSTVLKYFEDHGEPDDELPLLNWACRATIHRAQQSMLAVLWNYPLRSLAWMLRFIIFPYGKAYAPPDDRIIHSAADVLLHPSAARERLTQGIFMTEDREDRTGRIEYAFRCVIDADAAERKLRDAIKKGSLTPGWQEDDIEIALQQKLLDANEADLIREARAATRNAIMVDEFTPQEV
jgi:acyl-CoA dehydrogenase